MLLDDYLISQFGNISNSPFVIGNECLKNNISKLESDLNLEFLVTKISPEFFMLMVQLSKYVDEKLILNALNKGDCVFLESVYEFVRKELDKDRKKIVEMYKKAKENKKISEEIVILLTQKPFLVLNGDLIVFKLFKEEMPQDLKQEKSFQNYLKKMTDKVFDFAKEHNYFCFRISDEYTFVLSVVRPIEYEVLFLNNMDDKLKAERARKLRAFNTSLKDSSCFDNSIEKELARI